MKWGGEKNIHQTLPCHGVFVSLLFCPAFKCHPHLSNYKICIQINDSILAEDLNIQTPPTLISLFMFQHCSQYPKALGAETIYLKFSSNKGTQYCPFVLGKKIQYPFPTKHCWLKYKRISNSFLFFSWHELHMHPMSFELTTSSSIHSCGRRKCHLRQSSLEKRTSNSQLVVTNQWQSYKEQSITIFQNPAKPSQTNYFLKELCYQEKAEKKRKRKSQGTEVFQM